MIELSLIAGLAIFYLINLALGLYQGRNVRTAHTYVFGNRYSTGVLLLTLTGTFIGGGYLTYWFRAGSFYGGGSTFLWLTSVCITSLLVTFYLFPKLREFKNWYTLGDIACQAYDSRYVQLAIDSISVFSSLILLSAQLVALERASVLLGIDSTLGSYVLVISFTLVMIAYASRSGTPGVVSTDVLQMILILGGTSFILYKVLNLDINNVHIQGLGDLWHQVKVQYGKDPLRFFLKEPNFKRVFLSTLGAYASLLLFSPAVIKRVGMASNNHQLKRSMIGFITVFSLFIFTILIIGFGLYVVHGKVVGTNDVYPILLKIISNQLWAKLLLLIMLVAAIMSTADSILTATSLCLVRVVMSLRDDKNQLAAPKLSSLRLANVIVGCLALILTLLFMHYSIINFLSLATSLLGGLVPCVVGISLGAKRSAKALLASMACFGFLFIGSMILGEVVDFSFLDPRWTLPTFPFHLKYPTFLFLVILLSVLSYVFFEMMVHKGLKWEERTKFTEVKPGMFKRGWLEVKKFLGSPVLWAEEQIDSYESRGVLLTLVCIVAFLSSQFVAMPLHPVYLKPMTILMLSVFMLCTFNLFPEEWYQKIRLYYPLYWLISLVVCLPFGFLLRWLYHPTWVNALYLVFTPMLMHSFVGRRLGITLALPGYLLGFAVYRLTADVSLAVEQSHSIVPLVGLLCTTLFTWMLLGHHMQQRLKRASRPKLWASSWGHDLNHLFMEMQMETSVEYNPLPKEEKARLGEAERRLQVMSKHVKNFIVQTQAFKDLINRDSIRDSEIERLPVSKVVRQVFDTLSDQFKALIHIKGKASMNVKVCMSLFNNILTNLIRNAWKAGATKVTLHWDEKEPILYIKDNGPGIPKQKLATLFEPTSSRDGTGLGLPFIKVALAKMGALIDVRSSDEGTEFMILFEQDGIKRHGVSEK